MAFSALSNAQSLAADVQSMGNLKLEAGKNTPEAIRETAKQFESLFMRELMKSMRDATMKSGMLDSPGGDLGTDLLDQQFAVQMSGQPGGLTDLITAQLTRQMGTHAIGTIESKATTALNGKSVTSSSPQPTRAQQPPTQTQSTFVERHSKAASEVERNTGIPAAYMLGQAGHETGWGKFEIKHKGGAPAFNLFGIKAGASWTGKVAEVTTTEYVNGVAQKTVARFRAYDSYADSFKDYARLISESPRYANAKTQTHSVHAYASGLQKAGYATDPDYATKLSRAINATIAVRRAQT